MSYDPFSRGEHPVGVRTEMWTDASRDRDLCVEIWYPAADSHVGQDLDPATWDVFVPGWAAEGQDVADDLVHQEAVRDAEPAEAQLQRPLVLLIHGWAGYRREATFVGTHLASRGYIVVSPDVPGSTFVDVDAFLGACEPTAGPAALLAHTREIAAARVEDIPFLISSAVERLPVRSTGVGVTGASFGGYSSLIAPAADERVTAIVPMCPANDDAPILAPDEVFAPFFAMPWKSDAATLILAGDRDSLLPLYGQLRLLNSLPASDRRLIALTGTDHNHFVDDIELGQAWLGEFAARVGRIFPEGPGNWSYVADSVHPMERLLAGETTKDVWKGVIAAHFDAHLNGDGEAALALADLEGMLQARGIESSLVVAGVPSSS
jgi:dienelactone hydrolase